MTSLLNLYLLDVNFVASRVIMSDYTLRWLQINETEPPHVNLYLRRSLECSGGGLKTHPHELIEHFGTQSIYELAI